MLCRKCPGNLVPSILEYTGILFLYYFTDLCEWMMVWSCRLKKAEAGTEEKVEELTCQMEMYVSEQVQIFRKDYSFCCAHKQYNQNFAVL